MDYTIKAITLRIPERLYEALKKRKQKEDLSVVQQARSAIHQILQSESARSASQNRKRIS